MDSVIEVWKDVVGFEGFYKVSNLGRVKSLERKTEIKKGTFRTVNGCILKQHLRNDKYFCVNLSANRFRKSKNVHSLVAESFLNHTPNRKIVVDHINNISKDNRLVNLQIVTHRENCSKDKIDYSSDYVGISFNKKNNNWVSMININNKAKYLGSFDSEERASIAYNFALMQTDKIKELI